MSLTARLKRRAGMDTTTTITESYTLYEYTVTHLNGEETTFEANGKTYNESFAEFYIYESGYPILGIGSGIWPFKTYVKTLEGIQEIEATPVGETVLEITVDKADYTIVDKEVRIE